MPPSIYFQGINTFHLRYLRVSEVKERIRSDTLAKRLTTTLGAANLLGTEDTLSVLEVEQPNEGTPVDLLEAHKRKSERQAEAPLWF